MTKNSWKVVAIIFIIIAVLEFAFLCFAFQVGNELIENENECALNICRDYETYYFEDNFCYCYIDHELAYSEYIK